MSKEKSMQIKDSFYKLSDKLVNSLNSGEELTLNFHGEHTNFLRFNQSKVRQSTEVQQYSVSVDLVIDNKQMSRGFNITFDEDQDYKEALATLKYCQEQLPHLQEFNAVVSPQAGEGSERIVTAQKLEVNTVVPQMLGEMQSVDMAGIFTSGPVYQGVVNSKGQKHWFSNDSFYFDYSLYSAKQKAVKNCYAGKEWNEADFKSNFEVSKQLLDKMNLPEVNVQKGKHRVYLSPSAVGEIVGTMSWGGFSMGAYKKGYSPLKKLKDGEEILSGKFSVQENFELGLCPQFNEVGEVSSPVLNLVNNGKLENFLTSTMTAKEFGLESNFASSSEFPRSVVIKPGQVAKEDVLKELDTGLYVDNLHYINWSDRMSARLTGMTRFACFWVEKGEIKGPIKDLRFDESLYNAFGSELDSLTSHSEIIPETSTYFQRSIGGMSSPGMFINNFNFTL